MPSPPSEGRLRAASTTLRSQVWRQHRGIGLILVLFLGLGCLYSVTTPVFEASDELWHYPFVERLASGQGLPVQHADQLGPWRQEGSQPPLYYALGALLTRGIDTSDMATVRWINPHADIGTITRDRNVNMVIHTSHEAFPYRGTVLAIHVVRWMSLLMGAVTVLAGYLLAGQVFPGDRIVALATASVTGFNAMFTFISASVNNDSLVIMLCCICLWLMVKYVADRPSTGQWLLLGVLLGLGSISKASALGMLPLAALTILFTAWRHRSGKDLLAGGLLVSLPILLLGGWWYYRNWRLYRDPTGLSAFVAIVGARYPVPTLRQLMGEWKGFVMSYWGVFGGMNVPAPGWIYWTLSVPGVAGLVGAPAYILRAYRAGTLGPERRLQLGLVILWPCLLLAALVRWTMMTTASQGRLMFPAITAISLVMVMGLAGLTPSRLRALLPVAMSVAELAIAFLLPFVTIRPAYAPPILLADRDVAGLWPRLDVTFGEKMRLLGYELENDQVSPGGDLTVTLYWKALAPMQDNYSLFIHLLGANDLIIGQRDVYPGQGNYPTTLWSPGQIIADTYVIPISPATLTPQEAKLEVGLYRLESGKRLPVTDSTGAEMGDNVRFGQIILPLRTAQGIPNPVHFNLENRVALIGYDLDRTAARPGESFHLTLYWRALREGDTNYSVFTHVLGEQDRIWAQMDGWPQEGDSPTSTWHKGQVVQDPYQLLVAVDAPPGAYDIEVGMYDASGRRLRVLGEGGYVQGTRIILSKVRILSNPRRS